MNALKDLGEPKAGFRLSASRIVGCALLLASTAGAASDSRLEFAGAPAELVISEVSPRNLRVQLLPVIPPGAPIPNHSGDRGDRSEHPGMLVEFPQNERH